MAGKTSPSSLLPKYTKEMERNNVLKMNGATGKLQPNNTQYVSVYSNTKRVITNFFFVINCNPIIGV